MSEEKVFDATTGETVDLKAIEKRQREEYIRSQIFMVPGYELIRNPLDPRLYAPNKKISNPQDTQVVELSKTLVAHLFIEGGLGIAGPQIGWNAQVCAIINGPYQAVVLYNPRLVQATLDEKNTEWQEEGCLSHEGVTGEVLRLREFDFEASTYSHPKKRKYHASGMFARVLQHELNHLKGLLFTDLGPNVRNMKIVQEGQAVLQAENRYAAEHGFREPNL